jgi:hypothetical protein
MVEFVPPAQNLHTTEASMKKHADSHLDHNLTDEQVDFLLQKFAGRSAFFIETVELPEELGTVPCGLHGPLMGDEPIPAAEVTLAKRGNRSWGSRVCNRVPRQVRQVSVIAGPHTGEDGVEHACVLYTAFGGPVAPQEAADPECRNTAESMRFWGQHALSRE